MAVKIKPKDNLEGTLAGTVVDFNPTIPVKTKVVMHDFVGRKSKGALRDYRVCAIKDDTNYVAYRITEFGKSMKFLIEGAAASTIKEAYPSDTGQGTSMNLEGTTARLAYLEEELIARGFTCNFIKLCEEMIAYETGKQAYPSQYPHIRSYAPSNQTTNIVLDESLVVDDVGNDEATDENDENDEFIYPEDVAYDLHDLLIEAIGDYEGLETVPNWVKKARVLLATIVE